MQVRLLGPVDVVADGASGPVSGLRRKAVLTVLALQRGDIVSNDRLHQDLPNARWSWSMCDGLFTPRPLGPLFDLADQFGGTLLERCRAGADREELFSALLCQVSAPEALDVVVVEDIHWADEATLDLLRYLSRHAGATVRADPARGRSSRPDLRRAHQRGDRREAVYLR